MKAEENQLTKIAVQTQTNEVSHEGENERESRLPQVHFAEHSLSKTPALLRARLEVKKVAPRALKNRQENFMEFRYKLHQVCGS